MHAVLPLAFAYLGAGSKYNEEAVRRGAHQLRGQTEQGVTLVGEEEPGGQSALHVAEAVAEVSVDVPEGQGVQERAEEAALRGERGWNSRWMQGMSTDL